ncbi:MAG TPA: hypothetical protein VGS04_08215 [Nitrososphaerales archaeon]|nr:hypothetical protein [Nitrososphaerales archaeon]
MSAIRTFFRHCPSCGRRFEIRLVKKEGLGSEELTEDLKQPVPADVGIRAQGTLVTEDTPSIVDIEEFQYTYRCKHCGHEWSEVRTTADTFAAPKGFTGD